MPLVLFLSSVVTALGSGMTVKFFPLYFKKDCGLSPVGVQAVYACVPLLMIAFGALADRLAVYSLVQTGYVDPERLCAHVSQLWCARVGTFADRETEGRSHPLSNERGDALCAYLQTLM